MPKINLDLLIDLTEIDNNKRNYTEEEQKILDSIRGNTRAIIYKDMYEKRIKLFDDIYLTSYGYRTILVSLRCGGVFRFDNEKYKLIVEDDMLKLQQVQYPYQESIVYHNGIFSPTKGGKLMESRQGRSRKSEYKCFTVYKNRDLEEIIIADHQIQALFQLGVIALIAFGEDSIYCVDHRNGNKRDNRIGNLEVVTKLENVRRYHEGLKGKHN